jgi:hypothetical protein
MSLNYFFSYRNKYDQIIIHTEEIIRICDELINESFEYIESSNNENSKNTQYVLNDIEILNEQKNSHIRENEKLLKIRNHISKKIQNHCDHIFCEDEIDITPERSQKITYCTKCEYTKPN